jgi:hypothetical protein
VRKRAVVATVAAVLLALGGLAVWRFAFPSALQLPAPLKSEYCTARTGGEVTLTLDQMANAATISAVGIRRGMPERATAIALATALQESKLENLDGGDRDSVGLFQQRPSQGWGSPQQIANPRYAAGQFYSALLKVRNWQRLPLADAAQSVQRSAAPDEYAKWEADATVLAAAFRGDKPAAVACTIVSPPHTRGSPAVSGLASSFRLDWGATAALRMPSPSFLSVAVGSAKSGWQYAYWLVAHASVSGVQRVEFGQQAWSASDGAWRTVARSAVPASLSGSAVVAQVYAPTK